MGTLHTLTPPLRVVAQSPAGAHGFLAPEVARYSLTGTLDGYVIRDRGEVICRFHGARIDLAAATLRRLVDGENNPTETA